MMTVSPQAAISAISDSVPNAIERDFEVVLHVGYPKTGSSWLQDRVFANPRTGFAFLGGDKYGSRANTTAAFVTVNSFCDDISWARSFFGDELKRINETGQRRAVPVISDECLCGNVLNNTYSGRYIADRLYKTFPKAKILVGIREQKALAVSYYRQYIMDQGVHPLRMFLGRGDEPLGFSPILRADYLEFDRLVSYYGRLYGAENVLVVPLEMLKKDEQKYVQSILEFCQSDGVVPGPSAPDRVGLSAVALEIRRRLNPLVPLSPLVAPPSTPGQRVVGKLTKLVDRLAPKSWSAPMERRWKAMAAERYNGLFRESNRRLAALTGIDLAALGYDV